MIFLLKVPLLLVTWIFISFFLHSMSNYYGKMKWLARIFRRICHPRALIFLSILLLTFFYIRMFLSSLNPSITGDHNPRRSSLDVAGETFRRYAVKCGHENATAQCPSNYYPSNHIATHQNKNESRGSACPDYFRWIHEDLSPWRETGITPEMVSASAAMSAAYFRLVIVSGRAYVQTFQRSFETRDYFTQWGILQLLRLYPGKIPDLDLVFNCDDPPAIAKLTNPPSPPPPLFSYDSCAATSDIVFPDWSFWGWFEIGIKPWHTASKEIKEGNRMVEWKKREPYAFWRGNPRVSSGRRDLLKCNVSEEQDWNARILVNHWSAEKQQGFKNSNVADQCKHRYKIYIEGRTWSVSEKYILACDSPALIVKPRFHDFFSRNLMPLQHYWPIRREDKCGSIKHAVEWGNSHPKEAQAIGKAASKFIQEELAMRYVYDYMFHLLTAYSELLTYKPTVPPDAVELCSESMACSAPEESAMRKTMMESLVASPSDEPPCSMPPPHSPASLYSFLQRKENAIKQVEEWERQNWDHQYLETGS